MTAEQFKEWLAEFGLTGVEAASLLGVEPNTVSRYRKEGGPKMLGLACEALSERLRRSEKFDSARLKAMRERREAGLSYRAIGLEFGVTGARVSQLLFVADRKIREAGGDVAKRRAAKPLAKPARSGDPKDETRSFRLGATTPNGRWGATQEACLILLDHDVDTRGGKLVRIVSRAGNGRLLSERVVSSDRVRELPDDEAEKLLAYFSNTAWAKRYAARMSAAAPTSPE